jgi:hypothetical protein
VLVVVVVGENAAAVSGTRHEAVAAEAHGEGILEVDAATHLWTEAHGPHTKYTK